jgi:hypothetical protein
MYGTCKTVIALHIANKGFNNLGDNRWLHKLSQLLSSLMRCRGNDSFCSLHSTMISVPHITYILQMLEISYV